MYLRQDIQGERIEHEITNVDCCHERIQGRKEKRRRGWKEMIEFRS